MLIRKPIDANRARELFNYDELTGHLTWRKPAGKACNNEQAGHIPNQHRRKLYRVVRFDGVPYQAHRVIFAIMLGRVPDEIDHINGDGLDNRWSNLRECTKTQNNANRLKRAGTRSPYKGVTYFPKGLKHWRARITVGNRQVNLGHFKTQEEAAAAYQAAAAERFGQFARTE